MSEGKPIRGESLREAEQAALETLDPAIRSLRGVSFFGAKLLLGCRTPIRQLIQAVE